MGLVEGPALPKPKVISWACITDVKEYKSRLHAHEGEIHDAKYTLQVSS